MRDNFGLKKKYVVLILIGILALMAASIAVIYFSGRQSDKLTGSDLMAMVRKKNVIVCHIDSVNDFFSEYYNALAKGNEETLLSLYDDPSKAKYSMTVAEIVDHYDNIKVYITPGINKGEAACFVSSDIYFKSVKAPAPTVDSFYLKLDEKNNTVRILTSQYSDEDINTFLNLVARRNPVRTVISETEDTLYGMLEGNDELRNLYIVMSSITERNK